MVMPAARAGSKGYCEVAVGPAAFILLEVKVLDNSEGKRVNIHCSIRPEHGRAFAGHLKCGGLLRELEEPSKRVRLGLSLEGMDEFSAWADKVINSIAELTKVVQSVPKLGLTVKSSTPPAVAGLGLVSVSDWMCSSGPVSGIDLGTPYIGIAVGGRRLVAAAFLCQLADERLAASLRFWIPAKMLEDPECACYGNLVNGGWITTTPGNLIDYGQISNEILNLVKNNGYGTFGVAYDPWTAGEFAALFGESDIVTFPIRQGFAHLSHPCRSLDRILRRGGLVHDGNPAMSLMVSNLELEEDAAGNAKPSWTKSRGDIVGVSALINALAAYLRVMRAS
jgi:hypothetical protein